MKQNFACVVGARPNFMKMAPLLKAFEKYPDVSTTLIHTGQHYDAKLSDVFFEELGIKQPDISLDVGSASHGVQTARILEGMEQVLMDGNPDGEPFSRVIVVGDVNSTVAASLASVKLGIPVAHVEAGLRSFDRSMPEEINRVVTDSISETLFVSETAGIENLRNEGHAEENIHLVGNVMIDTLFRLLPKAQERPVLQELGLEPKQYCVVTLHRPANVDDATTLEMLLNVLIESSHSLPIVFPIHPRTKKRLHDFGLNGMLTEAEEIRQLPPLGYLDFLALSSQARVIVTDSGGLQEESTALGIPCLTMRSNTERPVTVKEGTSTLIGNDTQLLRRYLTEDLNTTYKRGICPELWDGHAAERLAQILCAGMNTKEAGSKEAVTVC